MGKHSSVKGAAYEVLKVSNDVNAIRRRRVLRRVGRRIAGKGAGRLMGKVFG